MTITFIIKCNVLVLPVMNIPIPKNSRLTKWLANINKHHRLDLCDNPLFSFSCATLCHTLLETFWKGARAFTISLVNLCTCLVCVGSVFRGSRLINNGFTRAKCCSWKPCSTERLLGEQAWVRCCANSVANKGRLSSVCWCCCLGVCCHWFLHLHLAFCVPFTHSLEISHIQEVFKHSLPCQTYQSGAFVYIDICSHGSLLASNIAKWRIACMK